jgi:16S rRNA (guanine966-N2)-methyltransferase
VRIISGSRKGHTIFAPPGRDTRPTSDRVRENVFNILGSVEETIVLDLYAGSGAMGLEALSRGAARATFVEHDRDACRVIGENLDKLGLKATVLPMDAVRAVEQERTTYDLVLSDPPYDYDEARLAKHLAKLLTADGLLVWESSSREPPPQIPGLEVRTSRKYGSARLTLFDK